MTGKDREYDVEGRGEPGHDPMLELSGVTARSSRGLVALHEVSLDVHAGEIVGIAGVSGNGQSELAEVVTGLRRLESGRIRIHGVDLTNNSARRYAETGVGHIPEDRIGMGLVRSAQVRDNAILREYRTHDLSGRFSLRRGRVAEFARSLVTASRVQTQSIHSLVGHLSGGNQQRLLAGREAMIARQVFVAVHPTRGLDVQATDDVRRSLLQRRDSGCAVLLISEDLDEILLMSDRVAVMYEGRILGEFERANADREWIGLLMGGHVERTEQMEAPEQTDPAPAQPADQAEATLPMHRSDEADRTEPAP
jgi:simple sugar transport system ATP-binding protein